MKASEVIRRLQDAMAATGEDFDCWMTDEFEDMGFGSVEIDVVRIANMPHEEGDRFGPETYMAFMSQQASDAVQYVAESDARRTFMKVVRA